MKLWVMACEDVRGVDQILSLDMTTTPSNNITAGYRDWDLPFMGMARNIHPLLLYLCALSFFDLFINLKNCFLLNSLPYSQSVFSGMIN